MLVLRRTHQPRMWYSKQLFRRPHRAARPLRVRTMIGSPVRLAVESSGPCRREEALLSSRLLQQLSESQLQSKGRATPLEDRRPLGEVQEWMQAPPKLEKLRELQASTESLLF